MNGLLDLCIFIYFRLLYISLLSYILYCTRNSVSRLRVVLLINDLSIYLSIYLQREETRRKRFKHCKWFRVMDFNCVSVKAEWSTPVTSSRILPPLPLVLVIFAPLCDDTETTKNEN